MIGAIVQARMGSQRLPGKVLMPLQGKPILEFVLQRLKRCRRLNCVGVATSAAPDNHPIQSLANRIQVPVYAGSEDDVLDRYFQAASRFGLSAVVRVTADCPLIDPEIVDALVDLFLSENADYATNVDPVPTFPDGMDVEVVRMDVLERAWKEARAPFQREHVTPYIRENPSFRKSFLKSSVDWSSYRLTVDTAADYDLVCRLVELLPEESHLRDVMEVMRQHPELSGLNSHLIRDEKYVRQKAEWKEQARLRGKIDEPGSSGKE